MPTNWSILHTPAANVLATITRPAGGVNVYHHANSIVAAVTVDATYVGGVVPVLVVLRDGATGVGPVLWAKRLQITGDGPHSVDVSGLDIAGSANTDMTLEFSAAGGLGSFESVTLTGSSS